MSRIRVRSSGVPAYVVGVLLAMGLLLLGAQFVVAQQPSPNFTFTPQAPLPGDTVTFTATGLRPNSTVSWDFENDGRFDATGTTVQHVYATGGQRTVLMRVTRPDGSATDVLKAVNVNTPPTASIVASPNPATVGEPVQLSASGSSDPDGTIASYAWDLDNDGQFDDASGVAASRSFAAPGTYTVGLRVTDNRGSSGTTTAAVTVNGAPAPVPPLNQAPVASFTATPNPATVGQIVQLNASGSSDPDGTIASYAWDLDNDGQFDDGSGATASRSFAAPGNYTVRLRVTDNRGAMGTATAVVTVNSAPAPVPPLNQAPVASFTATPNPATVGQTVQLNASGSSDPDGTIAGYAWDLDNDGQFDDGSGATASRSFAVPGTYTVGLRVTDNRGATDTATSVVTVNGILVTPPAPPPNAPPVASFTAFPRLPLVGDTVQLVSTSRDPEGPIATYAWDLDDDGQFDDSSSRAPMVRFGAAGAYPVSLRVTDMRGASDIATQNVIVGVRAAAAGRLELMRPFPVVRIVGRSTGLGARIRLLAVRSAPRGAKVTVRCRGRRCRLRPRSAYVRSSSVRFRSFERSVPAGSRIQVYITQAGKIGKYTSFKIRGTRPPRRTDLCVTSVRAKPQRCPTS